MADTNPLSSSIPTEALVERNHDTIESLLLEKEIAIQNLRESEALYRHLFEQHHAIMLIIDYQSQIIVDANIAAATFYGYPIASLRGMKVSRINAHPESVIQPQRQQAILGVRSKFVIDHRLANNEIRAVEAHITKVNYKNNNLFFSVIHDITEQKQLDENIRHLAFRDHLTQLPNRHLFHDRLSQSMLASKRSGRHIALIMLDLDNFKLINDKYGHLVGDSLLKTAADRLKMCVREIDTAARFGGDEFVVIINDLDEDQATATSQALAIAKNILASLSSPYILTVSSNEKTPITVEHLCTASIGVVVFLDHEGSHEEIMKHADEAMYQVKEAGRNSIRIYDLKGREIKT